MSPRQASACCRPVDALLDPEMFKALGDPTRIRLLGCLVKCGRACSVTEVAECCSVDLSVVSRHLKVLERAGMLEASKTGRSVSYRVLYAELCRGLRSLAQAIEDCCPADELDSPRACAGGCRGKC